MYAQGEGTRQRHRTYVASSPVGSCGLSVQGMIMQPCMGQMLEAERHHIASGHDTITSGMLQRVPALQQQQQCGLDDQKHRPSCTQCMGARRIPHSTCCDCEAPVNDRSLKSPCQLGSGLTGQAVKQQYLTQQLWHSCMIKADMQPQSDNAHL